MSADIVWSILFSLFCVMLLILGNKNNHNEM